MEQTEGDAARRKRMRDRKAAVAIAACVAVALGVPAAYFIPFAVQHAEDPSVEEAITLANRGAGGDYAFALEREYVDGEGRTVYRLVSDSDPVVVKEMRREFRWFPEVVWSRAIVPGFHFVGPGPYYEVANKDEWRQTWQEWDSEQKRREGRDWQSLHPQGGQGAEEAEAEEG